MADFRVSFANGSGALQRLVDQGDGTHAPVVHAVAQNITGKFRDAFEVYDPLSGGRWAESKAAGDLIFVDGNAAAASYLVISKNPLVAGTESAIETVGMYGMPIELAFGASMSQRTLGQEFAVELVSVEPPLPNVSDLAISAISQTTTVLTVDTVLAHGLTPGKSIGIIGCSDSRANYPSLVVATIPSPTQFTATAGPGGTIPSLSITNPAGAKGSVYVRERFGRAVNGASQIFENATATNASMYIRSESGDALPSGTIAGSHAVTVGTTAPVQLVNAPFTYAFAPTTEFRINVQADRTQWYDSAVDAVAQTASRLLRTQVCPDPEHEYKLRLRATNNKGLTVPVAQIVSAVKTASTTATITTATPHGLTTADVVVVYGIRAQGAAEFPNLLTATAVASVVDATNFTIVIGTSGTITSYGGYVARVNGGNLMSALGGNAVVAQSAVLSTLSDGTRQLVLTGNTNWAGLTIGDMVELVGVRDNVAGVSLGVDGPWKVANSVTTALTLVLPFANQRTIPANFGSTNCGGGVIKRTCLRLSFVRLFDYERQRVELLARPSGDISSAAPVAVQNTPAVTLTSTTIAGTAAVDAAIGNPVTAGLRASNANITAMSAAGDNVGWLGTMIGAGVVRPYSLPEADWITPAPIGGIVNTTTPFQVRESAGAGIRNYVTAIDLVSEALTNATDLRIREPDLTAASQTIASNTLTTGTHGLAIGDAVVATASGVTGLTTGVTYFVLTVPAATTMTLSATRGGSTLAISGTSVTATLHKVLWQTRIPTTGMVPRQIIFPTPLRGSIATAVLLQTSTASGAGAVHASIQGHSAP
jgi:hypothetical protein